MKKQTFVKIKKGELTTTQLVTLIILIASFVIILFLIFRLNLGQQSDKEICRNSVILSSKSAKLASPLDCRTNYLCIYSGSSKCTQSATTSTSETQVDSGDKVQIMHALANEMSDCWFEFGEGKIDYGAYFSSTAKYALCSVVTFNADIQGKTPEITYKEFYDYLAKTQRTSDSQQTYLSYLYGVNDVSLVPVDSITIDISSDKILTNGKYSIITGWDDHILTPDKVVHVYIIPTSETDSRLYSDREFVTKA